MSWSLAFDPFVPWWLIGLAALVALAVVAFGVTRRIRGMIIRGLVFLALLAALADPSLVEEQRQPLKSVVAVVADRSGSQGIGSRTADTTATVDALTDRLSRLPDVEVRVVESGRDGTRDGTHLFGDVARALSDVPPDRIAGIVAVTDGEVHDAPPDTAALGFDAPVHGLVTGYAGEIDRRIVMVSAPKFGLVESTQVLRFRVEDQGAEGSRPAATVVVSRDGEEIDRREVAPGDEVSLDVEVAHGGPNIFEIATDPIEGELSPVNNRAVAVIEGIRENLRVLLVSGEPHVGERTWRNLLKSDASVDLVHFTILRPPEKQDGTPINELSLIAFPTRELFATKIDEFDLIIFDRYEQRGVLPLIYFDNIARYVADGGAVLIAAGPNPDDEDSVYDTPLAPTLPARPTGAVLEAPFHAEVSAEGLRHPVTRDLPGSDASPPAWSRWFRLIDAAAERGETVMTGPDDRPLLVLSREGEGRVAMLLSDQVWLWARGFEGGGPHVQLLRRLAHWLMKEPDLEEEALRLYADNGDLVVERQTLADTAQPVTVTMPSSEERPLTLQSAEPGLFRARIENAPLGLYRASDGDLTALAHVGPTDPKEYRSLLSTTAVLAPIAEATHGSVQRLKSAEEDAPTLPRIVLMRGGTSFGGPGWIGLDLSEAYEVTGIERTRLLAGFLGLALFLAALGGTWWREGR